MATESFFHSVSLSALDSGDHRAAILRADEERAAERLTQIRAQSSTLATPVERIRLWEALHGLNLPLRAGHKLLQVIADDTALSVEQVNDERERRSAARQVTAG